MATKEDIKNKDLEKNVWIGNDGTLHVKITRLISEEEINQLIDMVEKGLRDLGGKAKALIDISATSLVYSSLTRKKAADRVRKLGEIGYQKGAIFSPHVISRTISSFIVAASGIGNVKVFSTEKEALNWLNKPLSF